MTGEPERDPLDILRAADPVDEQRLPPASLARIRARVRKDTQTMERTQADQGRPIRMAGVAAGVFAVAALGVIVLDGAGGPAAVIPGPTPGTVMAGSCIELYSLDTLPRRDHAFDGTVVEIDGERITFEVNAAYKGVDGRRVTLEAPGMTGTVITSAGGPTFVAGERYLVAGDDVFAWACGYSQPYDAGVAAAWARRLGG